MFFQCIYAWTIELGGTKTCHICLLRCCFANAQNLLIYSPRKNQIGAWCSFQYFLVFKDFIRDRIHLTSHQRHTMVIDWHRVWLRYHYSEPRCQCSHWSKASYLLKRWKFHLLVCCFCSQQLETGCRNAGGRRDNVFISLFKTTYYLLSTVWQLMVFFTKVDLVLSLSLLGAFVNWGYTHTMLPLLTLVGSVCAVMLGDGSGSVMLSYLKVFSIQIILSFSSL